VNDCTELFGESGDLERELSVVFVEIELSALGADFRRGLRLIDRCGDTMDVEDACEGEATEARTNNRNGWLCCKKKADLSEWWEKEHKRVYHGRTAALQMASL